MRRHGPGFVGQVCSLDTEVSSQVLACAAVPRSPYLLQLAGDINTGR